MTKILSRLSLALVGMACLALNALPAHAQNTRSWVSGAGSDANACTRSAPCLTFARALTQTNAGGLINCLDTGGFGLLTIDKAITIDCTGTFAAVPAPSGNGILINAGVSDVVRLRGLSIEGAGTLTDGISVVQVGALLVEQCKISGFAGQGINFGVPSGVGSELYVSDSVISENGSSIIIIRGGILVAPSGTATVRASLSNVKLDNNFSGLIVRSIGPSTGQISLSMRDSTAAGNSTNGIQIISQGAPVVVALDNVTATTNSTGLLVDGAANRVLITRLTATSNLIGMSTVNSGVIVSYGDNHINNNISVNGAPTVVQPPQ
jgi:hypothetical protein